MIYFIFIILIIEQILYLALSTFVCRYGIPVSSIRISGSKALSIFSNDDKNLYSVKLRVNDKNDEFFFRNKFPIPMWGPLLLVGQVRKEYPTVIKVRVGLFTGVFTVLILIGHVFKSSVSLNDIINTLCFVGLMAFYVIWFRKAVHRNFTK